MKPSSQLPTGAASKLAVLVVVVVGLGVASFSADEHAENERIIVAATRAAAVGPRRVRRATISGR
jgi:hypothetical protein